MESQREMTEMYDNALLGILQHVGNIQDFLQIYFRFLYRKTDFYRLLSSPRDKMGFPPGVAEMMVLKTFKVFEKLAEQDRERQLVQIQKRAERESRLVPAAVQELEVVSEKTEELSTEGAQMENNNSPLDAGDVSVPAATEATVCPQPDADSGGRSEVPRPSAQGDSAEESQERFQSDPDSYNGAVRENYSWSQDYTDVEVHVFVPKTVIKGFQVSVSLQTSSIQVSMRDGAMEEILMKGEFTHKINAENSLWSLEPGRCVNLSLNKDSEVWWSAVLKGEREINVNRINRERSMATVDEEEHAVLERLTFENHQKLQGKPQSHEKKAHEMLKKGWDAEGSPFIGQQFDPSMFDIPPGAVQL
ncbi:nudC domain-containing protein 3-like [Solea solea]|uniref:nudC domain-containing protein 3-like n=1 Tax=Solea solea TaxID=90069 RepID=UPI00272CE3B6|nr:nudC domain-containing protein 3-like [Solea solea]